MQHYDKIASGYEDLWAFRKTYQNAFVDDVLNYISQDKLLDIKNMTVADIGSGTGAMLRLLGEAATFKKFLAVEPCADMLDQVKAYGDTPTEKFCMGGTEFSKLESVRYDASIFYQVIHHIPEKELPDFLTGTFNQINPGGSIVVSTYGSDLPFPFWPKLVREYTGLYPPAEYYREAIGEAGFEDVTCVKRSFGDIKMARDKWLWMLRNRFVSTLSELSDEDIEEGIKCMDYPDPVVFEEWQYLVKGRKPLVRTIQDHIGSSV